MRDLLPLVVLALALSVSPARAVTGVPDPVASTLPDCMVTCPLGDLSFAVVVRDATSLPIPLADVTIVFYNCPGAYLCPGMASDPYVVNTTQRTLTGITDTNGAIDFHPRVGGTGPAGSVEVYANGIYLKSYALASPDQNGDGVVIGSPDPDGTTFAAKLGTTDPTADFTCDGTVDAADQAFFDAHVSHSCAGIVNPAKQRTWGVIKILYR